MDIFILVVIILLLILGVVGSILPIILGPPISYVAVLLYHFFIANINENTLIWLALSVIIVTILDYFLQIYFVKQAGGGKYAIRGSIVGMLLGIFLIPPFGILIGALIGAYIGAKIEMKNNAVSIAFGALWGFIAGTILKLCISFYMIYFLFFS